MIILYCFIFEIILEKGFCKYSKHHPKGGATLAPKVQDNRINEFYCFIFEIILEKGFCKCPIKLLRSLRVTRFARRTLREIMNSIVSSLKSSWKKVFANVNTGLIILYLPKSWRVTRFARRTHREIMNYIVLFFLLAKCRILRMLLTFRENTKQNE